MQALFIAGGVFFIGVGLATAINRMKLGDSTTFIALLLTPLLVYGIASGKVQEFTAPGGWGAKFREEAQATVAPSSVIPLAQAEQKFEVVSKAGLEQLAGLGAKLQRDKPLALSFQFGQTGYQADIAAKYIQFMLLADRDMTVLLLDRDGRFVAMTEGRAMETMLKTPGQGQRIMAAISQDNKAYILSLPSFHTNTVKAGDSNATALKKMREENTHSIVVVDATDHPTGVVKRNNIVAGLLEKLALADK